LAVPPPDLSQDVPFSDESFPSPAHNRNLAYSGRSILSG
jgi:hypothetical protein